MNDARTTYAVSSGAGVTPVGLVVRLYETVIADLSRAILAIRDADVEKRTFELQHALVVIGQLQASLDMQNGGEPATVLDRFYDMARTRIMNAQIRQSGKLLEDVMRDFLLLRDSWAEVDTAVRPTTPGQAAKQGEPGEWSA